MNNQDLKQIQLLIQSVNLYGMGEVFWQDEKYLVPFVLPNEEVLVKVIGKKKGSYICELEKVLKPSEHRTKPKCQYFSECGGCDLQHMSYELQTQLKELWVKNLISYVGELNHTTIKSIVPCQNEFNYRNRITFHASDQKYGFYKQKSHEIIQINECNIASEKINKKIKEGINLDIVNLEHDASFELREDESQGFVQVNSMQNTVLQKLVLELSDLKKRDHVLDLYCGAGNFTFLLSKKANNVLGIDGDEQAINYALSQKKKTKNKKINFIASDVLSVVSDLAHDYKKYDVIVCDPPRMGLGTVSSYLTRLKPKSIIYVSCSPNHFIKDAKFLVSQGFELNQVIPVDMFPQTRHVELVAQFSKKS